MIYFSVGHCTQAQTRKDRKNDTNR
jgi:hypothetical protein